MQAVNKNAMLRHATLLLLWMMEFCFSFIFHLSLFLSRSRCHNKWWTKPYHSRPSFPLSLPPLSLSLSLPLFTSFSLKTSFQSILWVELLVVLWKSFRGFQNVWWSIMCHSGCECVSIFVCPSSVLSAQEVWCWWWHFIDGKSLYSCEKESGRKDGSFVGVFRNRSENPLDDESN